jgi:pyruvate/2-oxoglutarate dehydrogenase complex dihydrolipoamide acyltransferase (E2) component
MTDSQYVRLPDLGLDDQSVVLSVWLVKEGTRVSAGEPVVEVLAGCATVDLPAPTDGILIQKLAAEGETIAIGQPLGRIEEPVADAF